MVVGAAQLAQKMRVFVGLYNSLSSARIGAT